jgi:hypothetical protein
MAINPNPLFIPPHPLRKPRNLTEQGQKDYINALWPQVYTGEGYAEIQRYNASAAKTTEGMATTPDDYFN